MLRRSQDMSRTLTSQTILDSIDALKARKARPDKTRILHHVERKFPGYTRDTILDTLAKAVDDGSVIKVKYKESISYRNASKLMKNTRPGRRECDATDPAHVIVKRIVQSIRGLTQTIQSSTNGTSLPDILVAIQNKRHSMNMDSQQLKQHLDREVESGVIRQLSNGNYVVPSNKRINRRSTSDERPVKRLSKKLAAEASEQTNQNQSKDDHDDNSTVKGSSDDEVVKEPPKKKANKQSLLAAKAKKKAVETIVQRGRPVSQRKKIKKSLGPDFLDPSDLGFHMRNSIGPKCDFCQNSTNAKKEDILICISCGFKAHPSCLKQSCDITEISPNPEWQCYDCKNPCQICKKVPETREPLIICRICYNSYHESCLDLDNEIADKVSWICSKCSEEKNDEVISNTKDSSFDASTVESSSNSNLSDEEESIKITEVLDEEIDNDNENESEIDEEERAVEDDENDDEDKELVIESIDNCADNIVEELTENGQPDCSDVCDSGDKADDKSQDEVLAEKETATILEEPPKLNGEAHTLPVNPSDWTIEDVEEFIKTIGYRDQATLFRDQEIDGKSLLLLNRMDVLTGLAMKLGPALKIYAHIQHLQGSKQCKDS